MPFCDLTRDMPALGAKIDQAMSRVRERGVFFGGPEVEAFEREWAEYCGQNYCVATGNGTDALALASAVTPGCVVRIVATTLAATAIGMARGGKSVYVIDGTPLARPRETEIDVEVLLYGAWPRTRAIAPRVWDCCQAHGWRPPRGAVCAWSFYPTKPLGALGDAGAVTCDDPLLDARMRQLRSPGNLIPTRLDEVHAAVLRVKLPHLDAWIRERQALAAIYWERLDAVKHVQLIVAPDAGNHYVFPVLCERRDALREFLRDRRIHTMVHYPTALHLDGRSWQRKIGDCPMASDWCARVLSLPLFPGMTMEEISHVANSILAFGR